MYLLSLVTLAFAVKLTALVLTDASVVAAAAVDWSWLIEDIVVIVVVVATTVVVEFVVVDVNFSAVADCCSHKRLIYILLFKAFLVWLFVFWTKEDVCAHACACTHIFSGKIVHYCIDIYVRYPFRLSVRVRFTTTTSTAVPTAVAA